MKKIKISKLNINHWVKVVSSLVLAILVCYVLILVYMHYSNAGVFKLANYLSKDKDVTANEGYPECPKLMKVEGNSGAIIIRDECTNLYWNRLDLPLEDESGNREGYNWQEANDYCRNLATIEAVDYPIFRLPTADELLSLTYTPCLNNPAGGCSPITNDTSQFKNADGTDAGQILPNDNKVQYFYKKTNGIKFAQGAYWTKDELDMDGNLNNVPEAASSVNLFYGVVNNPVFAKGVRLNVRCIFDNPIVTGSREGVTATNYNINEIQWWNEGTSTCPDGSKKLSLARRKNLTPRNGSLSLNACPEGYNDEVTGDLALCAGVTEITNQCQYFSCPPGKDYVKNTVYTAGTDSPIKCD